jgi:hypothetical protein
MTPSTAIISEDICLVAYLEGRWASSFVRKRAEMVHRDDTEFVHKMLSASIRDMVCCPWCSEKFD